MFLLVLLLAVVVSEIHSLSPGAAYREAYNEFVFNKAPSRSLSLYDKIPRSPYLWQRGLAAYCAGDYAAAVDQFRYDKEVNGNDGEVRCPFMPGRITCQF